MKKLLNNLILWFYIKIHSILINIGIILYRSENDVFNVNPEISENKKQVQRIYHRNEFIEMMIRGIKNDKIVQQYYELLEKADKFKRNATPYKMEVAAYKYNTNYGMKDQYGRRYEHYGFFDEKHKHSGKTLGEVLTLELEERRTKDDDYEIMQVINNIPIEVGIVKILDVIEKTIKKDVDFEYEVQDMIKKSKQFEFPIKATHNNEKIINKIEELTEYLHIKKIGFEYRQLEFFIPLKFKTGEIQDNSDVFNELIDVKQIFIKDTYGQLVGFGIIKFIKRIIHNDTHEVWKFEGFEMKIMGETN